MEQQQIVCIAFPKWEGTYMKSTVQLMTELAQAHQVLYVDYPYTWKDMLQGLKPSSTYPVKRMLGLESPLRTQQLDNGASIHILTLPPFIPSNFLDQPALFDQVLQWNSRRALKRIKWAMQQLSIQQPIVINAFSPALGTKLKGQLNEKLLAYYCYDEIGATVWSGKHGARYETQFLSEVDITLVSSTPLWHRKKDMTKRCAIVKNGVGPQFFVTPGPAPADVPSNGPIIGYLGSLDERLDEALLLGLIQALPKAQFVFVGRIVDHQKAKTLEAYSNVYLLGPRPPHQLATYVNTFAVGLIPFIKNELTAGIYPLKVNEYLALGKPVIATPFADLSDFEGLISIADGTPAFTQAIQHALTTDTPSAQATRKSLAQAHTWRTRAKRLVQYLDSGQGPVDSGQWAVVSGQELAGGGQGPVDSVQEIVDSGQQAVDSGQGSVDSVQEIVDSGQEIVDSSQQTVGSGQQAVDSGQETADGGVKAKRNSQHNTSPVPPPPSSPLHPPPPLLQNPSPLNSQTPKPLNPQTPTPPTSPPSHVRNTTI